MALAFFSPLGVRAAESVIKTHFDEKRPPSLQLSAIGKTTGAELLKRGLGLCPEDVVVSARPTPEALADSLASKIL